MVHLLSPGETACDHVSNLKERHWTNPSRFNDESTEQTKNKGASSNWKFTCEIATNITLGVEWKHVEINLTKKVQRLGHSSVIEHMPGTPEDLGSIPRTGKKNEV